MIRRIFGLQASYFSFFFRCLYLGLFKVPEQPVSLCGTSQYIPSTTAQFAEPRALKLISADLNIHSLDEVARMMPGLAPEV